MSPLPPHLMRAEFLPTLANLMNPTLARAAAEGEEFARLQTELRTHFGAEGAHAIVARILDEARSLPGESDVLGRVRQVLTDANARAAAGVQIAPHLQATFAELAVIATSRSVSAVRYTPPPVPPPRNRAARRAAARARRRG